MRRPVKKIKDLLERTFRTVCQYRIVGTVDGIPWTCELRGGTTEQEARDVLAAHDHPRCELRLEHRDPGAWIPVKEVEAADA